MPAMRDVFIDVMLEVPASEILRLSPAAADQTMTEALRAVADNEVAKVKGAYLRVDRPVDLHVAEGQHRLTGASVYLISARWPAVAPDDVMVSS